ncbi:MAG: hypothetical protein JW953_06185 [Anaerolineae bacterium]|nr:hypothetical protein [Anaerolineae bacterium]
MLAEQKTSSHIGSLNEKPLHAALKEWYAQPNDQVEVAVDGFVIDLVRGDLLIEIQTRSFAGIKQKLAKLVEQHPVRLVYPIAQEKWIVKLSDDETSQASRRKSPKRGALLEVFKELVSFPHLLPHPHFSLHVLLIQEEEVRRFDGRRGWRRRGWVTHERRLLHVVKQQLFETPAELQALLPGELAEPFTTAELALATGQPRWLAQKMAYCLRQMGTIEAIGKRGKAVLYTQII